MTNTGHDWGDARHICSGILLIGNSYPHIDWRFQINNYCRREQTQKIHSASSQITVVFYYDTMEGFYTHDYVAITLILQLYFYGNKGRNIGGANSNQDWKECKHGMKTLLVPCAIHTT